MRANDLMFMLKHSGTGDRGILWYIVVNAPMVAGSLTLKHMFIQP